MLKKELLLCLFLIVMGILDWLTTLLGLLYFGTVEINPLLTGVVNSNILVFSGIKLATTVFIGFLFYKGFTSKKTLGINSNIGKRFLESGYCISLMVLTFVVTNNVIAVARVQ